MPEIGQIVVVGVGVVDEPTFFDQQFARVHRGAIAAIPALGPLPDRGLERLNRPQHVLLLFLARERPDFLPTPAVAARFVAGFLEPGGHLAVAFKGRRRGKERQRELVSVDGAAGPARPRRVRHIRRRTPRPGRGR